MSLTDLFEKQDQSVPMSQVSTRQLSSSKQPTASIKYPAGLTHESKKLESSEDELNEANNNPTSLIETFVGRDSKERVKDTRLPGDSDNDAKTLSKDKQRLVGKLRKNIGKNIQSDDHDDDCKLSEADVVDRSPSIAVHDFNQRIAEQQAKAKAKPGPSSDDSSDETMFNDGQQVKPPSSSIVQNAFDRMRPRQNSPSVATITVDSKTITSRLASPKRSGSARKPSNSVLSGDLVDHVTQNTFSSTMRSFVASGSELSKTLERSQGGVPERHASPRFIALNDRCGNASRDEELLNAEDEPSNDSQSQCESDPGSDGECLGEHEKKAMEDAKIAEMIRQAEEASANLTTDNKKRAHQILKGAGQRASTSHLAQWMDASVELIDEQLSAIANTTREDHLVSDLPVFHISTADVESSPEERLSLIFSKNDFAGMHVLGQFNLGFVLATRNNADLFIIDQHAADEKYNFERLQANIVVQNQRLVHPHTLQLTAIEEEIVLERNEVLVKNGFLVDVDTSGDLPVGQRCKIVSLPTSREVTFKVTDLEELITLLADTPISGSTENWPRPTKVRRMLAMRACRSSIMVGRTLTLKQMISLVGKMGQIDKPWNCPHGRPTMRHLCELNGLGAWKEGDGLVGLHEEEDTVDWLSWCRSTAKRQKEDRDQPNLETRKGDLQVSGYDEETESSDD